jgi:thiamine kinase-like enzyme
VKELTINNKIIKKIESLKIKTKYPDYLDYLKSFVNNNQIIVPKTFCHGDLTFNNIIFHKNRLFFIDFLDSYIDSFFSDLVKLKQDLYYLWSLKVQEEKTLRLIQIYRYIWQKLSERYERYINTKGFEILDVMNILRIEPYLTNNNQRIILDTIVKSTKLYEKFDYSNGRKI